MRLGDEQILVLDCRSENDPYSPDLQIPGALRISLEDLPRAAHCLPDDELIVVCGLAQGARTWRACRLLRLRGLDAVVLAGGLNAWISQGFPTERPEQARRPTADIPFGL